LLEEVTQQTRYPQPCIYRRLSVTGSEAAGRGVAFFRALLFAANLAITTS